jgi:hypothetical protein
MLIKRRKLVLFAEMKLPGGLEFKIINNVIKLLSSHTVFGETVLVLRSSFHGFLFKGMLQQID